MIMEDLVAIEQVGHDNTSKLFQVSVDYEYPNIIQNVENIVIWQSKVYPHYYVFEENKYDRDTLKMVILHEDTELKFFDSIQFIKYMYDNYNVPLPDYLKEKKV